MIHKQKFIVVHFLIALLLLASCAPKLEVLTGECGNALVVVPTLPAFIPEEFELDPSTNLHRTGTPQILDVEDYRLEVTGLVENPLSLTYEQLRCMPKISAEVVLNCPMTFTDRAEWSGVRLANILKIAGVKEGATRLRLTGADGYFAHVPLEDAMRPESFLAYEWEGETLPIMHGFPLRAVLPDIYGSQWVKWLVKIEVQ